MSTRPRLVVITGPTAVGKTALSVNLAKQWNTEVLSFDSRQFYRELTIGTAKPSEEEMRGVPHHFIGHLPITEPWTAGQFETAAVQRLQELFQRYSVVIATGGSGLYLTALLYGIEPMPEIPETIRQELRDAYAEKGLTYLQTEIQRVDPVYSASVDLQNPVRMLRALEVFRASGQPMSSFQQGVHRERPWETEVYVVHRERETLYQRIELRVDQMMQQGLLDEVRPLLAHRDLQALQTVGYTELFDYLEGKTSLEEAVRLVKRNSRRYAKRQLTWFRRYPEFRWVTPEQWEQQGPLPNRADP